jgi:hypothetical protein
MLKVNTKIVQVVHLFVMTAFAVAQPVFDRVGERPAFLSDMGVQPPAIVLFATLFSIILPAILAAGIWAVGRVFPRARAPFHTVVVYILLTVVGAPVVNRLDGLPPWLAIGLMAAAGAAATWAYFKFAGARSVVTVAAPAVVIFPAVFLLTSPMARQYFFFKPIVETSRWNPIPIVVVVLDELCGMTLMDEQRDVDARRFPHFAELARTSTWFRNATTVYPDTWQAVPAIISGRYPTDNWLPTVADRPQNLFSILDATGAYESTVFEPISRLATPKGVYAPRRDSNAIGQLFSLMPAVGRVLLFHVTPADLRSQLPKIPQLWFGLHDSGVVDPRQRHGVFRYAKGSDRRRQFDHFLECLDDSPRPQLDFMHVLLPHIPWCYLPSGRKCIAESSEWEVLDDNLVADELFAEQCQQRHLLQLEFVDSQIGRLLDRLRETGLYDKCLLLVTADHGVSFKAGEPRRAVTAGNRSDIMSVPLFIKTPGQTTGVVSDKNVESVDILPTIADLLGIELQLPVDGRSVFDNSTSERREKKFYDSIESDLRVPAAILSNSSVSQELRRRFGSPNDPEAMFRIGPHFELVGRRIDDLPPGTGAPVRIALIRSGTVYTQDRDALVPCYFEGRVVAPGKLEESVALAIAINGVIRATTRTYRLDGYRDRFAAMVPERAFREGPNDVQYYSISGADSDVRLTPCQVIAAASK